MTWSQASVDWAIKKWGSYGTPTPTGLIDVTRTHSCRWHVYSTGHTGNVKDWATTSQQPVGWMAKEWGQIRSDFDGTGSSLTPQGFAPEFARDGDELDIVDGTVECDVARWPRWRASVTVAAPRDATNILPTGNVLRFEWRNNLAKPSGQWAYEAAPQWEPDGPVVWPAWWLPPMQIVESVFDAGRGVWRVTAEDMTGVMARMRWPRPDLTWKELERAAGPITTLSAAFSAVEYLATSDPFGGYRNDLVGDADINSWFSDKVILPTDPVPGSNVMETFDALADMGGLDLTLLVGHATPGDPSRAASGPGKPVDALTGGMDPGFANGLPIASGAWLALSTMTPPDPGNGIQYVVATEENTAGFSLRFDSAPNEWWESFTLRNDAGDTKTRVGSATATGPMRWQKTGRNVVTAQRDTAGVTDAVWDRAKRDSIAARNLTRARRRWIIDDVEAIPDPGVREFMRVQFRRDGRNRVGLVRRIRHDLTGRQPMFLSIGSDTEAAP